MSHDIDIGTFSLYSIDDSTGRPDILVYSRELWNNGPHWHQSIITSVSNLVAELLPSQVFIVACTHRTVILRQHLRSLFVTYTSHISHLFACI